MATATLPISHRRTPWRAVLAIVAALVAVIVLLSFTVGFGGSSSTPTKVTNTSVASDQLLDCRQGRPC